MKNNCFLKGMLMQHKKIARKGIFNVKTFFHECLFINLTADFNSDWWTYALKNLAFNIIHFLYVTLKRKIYHEVWNSLNNLKKQPSRV